jgi:hypothetical protein
MTDHGSGPDKQTGSRRDGIDIEHRLQEMEKQRRVILNATDDERLRRCMRLVGADLGATQRLDFDAASELHDGLRAHREGQR